MSTEPKRRERVPEIEAERMAALATVAKPRVGSAGNTGGMNARLEIRNPGVVAEVLQLRTEGMLVKDVEKRTGVCANTQRRILRQHPEVVEKLQKLAATEHMILAERYLEMQHKKLDQIDEDEEELKKVSLRDLAIGGAINVDKSLGLSGKAAMIIEHRKGLTIEDAQAAIAAAREEAQRRLRESSMTVDAEILSE